LQHRSGLARRSPEFGEAFESFIFHELSTFIDYTEPMPLGYWWSTSNFEVDFVLADTRPAADGDEAYRRLILTLHRLPSHRS